MGITHADTWLSRLLIRGPFERLAASSRVSPSQLALRHTAALTDHLGMFLRLTSLLTITMIALMAAHVVEIAVWAAYLHLAGITIRGAGVFEFAFDPLPS